MKAISEPKELESAWKQQYEKLSGYFSRMIPKQGIAVEVGCGKGQLTIPLAKRVPKVQMIGVDSFKGPYAKNRTRQLFATSGSGRKVRIKVIVDDYDAWLQSQPQSKYDAIVSSEFLPELDSMQMREFFIESYRVIKNGGVTVHSFLSPEPRNVRQRRLIQADSDPRWTRTPPAEWFSPTPGRVVGLLERLGFKRARMFRWRSELLIRSSAARETLRDWDIRQSYWKSHRTELENDGLEVPDWLVIGARKLVS